MLSVIETDFVVFQKIKASMFCKIINNQKEATSIDVSEAHFFFKGL